ncbi:MULTISPECIES: LuxR C-terminal-related transcriptional regulator [Olivibacter]|uniref:LuxR C-terminal-related transcriptional regulator n=1 Tax=Olivibacter jilunii TaxID=985016 RepID=A0ABW6B3P9_9SPHI|nr:response regulator transcription factor [Olivibacter sp. UJ_SKK_5.1]MDX3916515.1 response regulator transcription factor [Pseudosphingobacterium sp.]
MDKNNTIAIIFDDHLLFADSFSALVERFEIFSAVHTFDDKRELTHFLIKHSKMRICLFLDYYLKNENSLTFINEVKRLNRRIMIIVMSSTISPTAIKNILDNKPHGFISKSSGFDTVLQCLTAIADGSQYICPVISEIVAHAKNVEKIPFTDRELEILQYFSRGLSIADTAEKAHLSRHTVVAHRRNMMSKANVNSITELLLYARKHELI